MKKDKIIIYTDGAARGNPGKAGWGAVILLSQNYGDPKGTQKIIEIGGRNDHATNNQMELTSAIEGLKYLKKHKNTQATPVYDVEIFADSKYVIHGATEWIHNWMKNNWRNSAKKPVLNRELWEELHKLTEEFKPKWHYVKGHSGDKWNDRADEIATSFADNEPVKLRK